ncbi:hypothetical protein [Spirillospora sp. CA-128828]|uniref:hypothetical protein n=1 Tax=Spirillospora sp. CA-128828 TaxID=3240033 RepID=UPI003D8E6353
MSALTVTEERDELVRLARVADSFPDASFSPVLELSALPLVETAEVFDRLRAALRGGDPTEVRRALDELTGGTR